MRVVHLSTFEQAGGAARAAHGLHRALLAEGVASEMVVMERQSRDETVHVAARDPIDARLEALCGRFWSAGNRTPLTNTAFSIGFGACDAVTHEAVGRADVINLHWVPQLLDARALGALRALDKPVVWTLHDEWAYTGGCHYTAGCERFREKCSACPQLARDPHALVELRFAQKRDACRDARIAVAAPSRWLARRARESAVLRGSRVECIPYGVDTDVFHPSRRSEGRARLGASDDEFVLLFSAEAAFERRKGFAELKAALETARSLLRDDAARLRLAVLGHAFGVELPEGSVTLGHVASRDELAAIVAACDLYAMPSLEDNLPNGVLEALACGTPCVGFDVGGVPDMLDGTPGCTVVPKGDVAALADSFVAAIRGMHAVRAHRGAIRADTEHRYAPAVQARAYRGLYRDLLGEKEDRP